MCSYRFDKSDIPRLLDALSIPSKYVCVQGTTATGIEALMILLRRLTYPNRLSDLTKLFGRSKTELSLIFNTVCELMLQIIQFIVVLVDFR